MDIPGHLTDEEFAILRDQVRGFTVIGYRLELYGYCAECTPEGTPAA